MRWIQSTSKVQGIYTACEYMQKNREKTLEIFIKLLDKRISMQYNSLVSKIDWGGILP